MSDQTCRASPYSSAELSEPDQQALKVWIYQDNRPGHVSQLKGLLSALQKEVNIEQRWIDAKASKFKLISILSPSRTKESPDIVIGAGHATHKSIVLSSRAHKAPSFVLMKPSLPLSFFTGVICPEHDGLRNSDRVFNTKGPISKTAEGNLAEQTKRSKHLLLIGGPSKHFVWDEDLLLEQICSICLSNPEIKWVLSDSPRTPKGFIDKVRNYQLANLSCYHYKNDNFGDISQTLLLSRFTWVTPDSMSMLYESLSMGSPTALFKLNPRKDAQNKRICRHISKLLNEEMVIGFDEWSVTKDKRFYPRKTVSLNEAKRAAKWLLARYQQLKAA